MTTQAEIYITITGGDSLVLQRVGIYVDWPDSGDANKLLLAEVAQDIANALLEDYCDTHLIDRHGRRRNVGSKNIGADTITDTFRLYQKIHAREVS